MVPWQVYSVSRNGQLLSFQCDTRLCDLVDTDRGDLQRDESSSSSDEDVEPQHTKKHKGD